METLERCCSLKHYSTALVWLVSGFIFMSQEYMWGCDKVISMYIWGNWSTELWYLASTLRAVRVVRADSLNLYVISSCLLLPWLLWHDEVTQSHDMTLHRLPFAQGLLMKSRWGRLPLLSYHQNFLLCSCWRLLWSTRRKKCCSVSYSTSLKASLNLQCTVFASKCVPSSPPATCGVFRVSTACHKPTLRRNIHNTTEQQEETHVPDAATERVQANTWSQKP